jgi:hypothetical protein
MSRSGWKMTGATRCGVVEHSDVLDYLEDVYRYEVESLPKAGHRIADWLTPEGSSTTSPGAWKSSCAMARTSAR